MLSREIAHLLLLFTIVYSTSSSSTRGVFNEHYDHDDDDDDGNDAGLDHQHQPLPLHYDIVINNQLDDYTDAYLLVNSTYYTRLVLSIRNRECVGCKYIDIANVTSGRNITVRLSTAYPSFYLSVRVYSTNEVFCKFNDSITFSEKGVYRLSISNEECKLATVFDSGFAYWPLVIAMLVFMFLTAIFIIIRLVYRKFYAKRYVRVVQTSTECDITVTESATVTSEQHDIVNPDAAYNIHKTVCCTQVNSTSELVKKDHGHQYQHPRLRFIDTFRGICLCVMIFVNYGAGGYSILEHAVWNGLHLADILFPCFIFIMGISIALSMHSIVHRHNAQTSTEENRATHRALVSSIVFRIVRRSALLFLFGLLTSNNCTVGIKEIRVMGILQRFSISYFVCALLELLYLLLNDFKYHEVGCFDIQCLRLPQKILRQHFKEIVLYKIQWLVMIIFTLTWTLVTFLLPVPGCPTGYLGPGGLHNNGLHENCTGGAAGYIDRVLFGPAHLYQWLTFRYMYQSKLAFDSEGLLGCLTSCVLTYLGVSAGHIIIHYQQASRRVFRFVAYGTICGTIALVLCKCTRDDGWIPINKNLWSLSFILAVASICFYILVLLYLLVDKMKFFSGKPFTFPGKNSISIYICHIVFSNFFPIQFHVPSTHAYLTVMHLYGVVLWCVVAWIMDLKRIFITI